MLCLDKRSLLVHEAYRWLGFTEVGGDNKGAVVEMFQKAVDGKAHGEPWCMSMQQYFLKQVDELAKILTFNDKELVISNQESHSIFKSEHCYTTWVKSPKVCRHEKPEPGFLAIWKSRFSDNGHTGIVVSVDGDEFKTIEGNTSPSTRGSQREGDGVFLKTRSGGIGSLQLKGFLNPWP